ncbi:MAG: hypothetical protein V1933_01105 [Candidatus Omnitrophota bacterium]
MKKEKMNLIVSTIVALFLASSLSFAEPESKGETSPPCAGGYTYNLKELIEKAKENIKKVDKELERKADEERSMQKEAMAQEHFGKGNILYEQGKLREAKQEWQNALDITKSPELEEYIKLSEKKARENELACQKEEKERLLRVKEEERKAKEEQARTEKERKDKEHLTRQEAEKQKKARLEVEEKARKERLAAERRDKEETEKARLEQERKQKEEQSRLEKQRKEKEAAEKEKQKKL